MAQITLRLPDELLEEIDDATEPETSRSEWVREAARARLVEDRPDDLDRRLDDFERRLERLEHEFNESLWDRFFNKW